MSNYGTYEYCLPSNPWHLINGTTKYPAGTLSFYVRSRGGYYGYQESDASVYLGRKFPSYASEGPPGACAYEEGPSGGGVHGCNPPGGNRGFPFGPPGAYEMSKPGGGPKDTNSSSEQ